MKLVVLLLVGLALTGCFRSNSQAGYRVTGTVDDHLVALSVAGGTSTQSGVDVSQALTAGLSALRGDLGRTLAAIRPPPARDYTSEIITGGASLASLIAMAAAKRASDKRADEHKADAEEGWKRALEPTTITSKTSSKT